MAKLIFRGFLPTEEKPPSFKEFREIASNLFSPLEGKLVFDYVKAYGQFEISENTTEMDYSALIERLGENSKYLL